MTLFYCFSSDLKSLVPPVTGRFEVVRFCRKSVCLQAMSFLLHHQNCESTSDGVMQLAIFHWLFLVPLVPNSDSQISEVIILNPNFATVSSKINVQIMILK